MTMLFLLARMLLLLGPQAIIFFQYFDTIKQRFSFIGVRTYFLYEMLLLFLYAHCPIDSGLIIEQLMELVKPPLNIAFMVWAFSTFNDNKVLKAIPTRKRIFYIMMGWSCAHNVTNYFFPLLNSFGKQFEWRYIEMEIWAQLNMFKFCVYAILAMRFSVQGWDPRLFVPHAVCGATIVAESLRPAASWFLPSSFNWIYFAASCTVVQLLCTLPWIGSAGRTSYKFGGSSPPLATEPEISNEKNGLSSSEKNSFESTSSSSHRQQQQQGKRKSKANKKKKKKKRY